jgi:hypothetical protein
MVGEECGLQPALTSKYSGRCGLDVGTCKFFCRTAARYEVVLVQNTTLTRKFAPAARYNPGCLLEKRTKRNHVVGDLN